MFEARACSLEQDLVDQTTRLEAQLAGLQEAMRQADQTTTRLTAELRTATADLARSRRAAEEADRGAFERTVLLEAAVDTHRALAEGRLGELEALRQMSQAQLQALEDERVTLQSRCEALSSALAAETAKAEEMRGTLHPQIEEWKVKAAGVEAQLQAKEREWGTARLGLTTEAELYRAKLFQERELGLSRERRHYEEATRLALLVDALQASEGTLQTELERTKEDLLQSQIQLQFASQQGALQIQSLNKKLTEAAPDWRTPDLWRGRPAGGHGTALRRARERPG
eukprot:TRINITY_DN8384_c0_g1_i1.p2 TRINITY_DN8384_c0_g1~~TRINITY_DN8384_c0_g1_i1.p2  ORF type:complete len:285 (+),score=46.85 TRINITY_DN8384_c0_g1_i1:518-1372(+)